MARKTYSAEFRRDAVELCRLTPAATVAGITADLGIMDTTRSGWIKSAGVPIRGQSRTRSGVTRAEARILDSWRRELRLPGHGIQTHRPRVAGTAGGRWTNIQHVKIGRLHVQVF